MSSSLERRIVIGMIVSTDYLKAIRKMYRVQFLQSPMAKRIATWCIEYFDKYNKVPFKDIEGIFFEKLKKGLPKELAEEIEEDILPSLNDEYEHIENFNVEYLLDQTKEYFKERNLLLHSEQIKALVEENELQEAENKALSYNNSPDTIEQGLFLDSSDALRALTNAFNKKLQRIITYPGALGEMWNDQLTRNSFVSLMGPEKRGKTFRLWDIAKRAIECKANVAFFQAGDMSESQQLKRIAISLAKKSDKQRYCGNLFIPVRDCLFNQLDTCEKEERECTYGVFNEEDFNKEQDIRRQLTYEILQEAYETEPEYKPCRNCNQIKGSLWFEEKHIEQPLTAKEARKKVKAFFRKHKARFKLSTHANDTLTIKEIISLLDTWEKQDGFVVDVIVIDYADLLSHPEKEFRHKQDKIWKGLRSLSEQRHCLVVTATQADANSYNQDSIGLKNFSEDKRKYAHVTAMYGLNQDKNGREKKIGLMRINEIVVRDGDFNPNNEVFVLQRLEIGRPYLGSFK